MKTIYTCFSTDVIHDGHKNIIKQALNYGRVIVGCLSDKEMIRCTKFPTKTVEERMALYRSMHGVEDVVIQNDMLYNDVIERSMLVLKLMSYYNGAVLAALTTSLPESVGEVRN